MDLISKETSKWYFDKLSDTQIVMLQEFYLVNIDNNTLYYAFTENDREYLHVIPLDNQSSRSKYLLNNVSRFDVSQGKIMVSDVTSQEGDIYRTVFWIEYIFQMENYLG